MCILSNQNKYISDSIYPLITFITYPLGYFMYFKDIKNLKKINVTLVVSFFNYCVYKVKVSRTLILQRFWE